MKITIAIPCYNLEDKISECLESVISQDYQDLELLVIDDHSTDASVDVIKDFKIDHPERDVRLIANEKNLGLSKVRNQAIAEARGDALFFVDGDDTIEPGTLTLFHRRMEETQADVVCGSFRRLDFDGKAYITKHFPEDTIKGCFAYASYIEKYVTGYFHIAVWNNLYRLDFLRAHDICCATHYRSYESSLFTFKVVLNAHCISFIPDITYNYCDMPGSICHHNKDREYMQTICAVKESVINCLHDFITNHKDLTLPHGIWFLLNFICLTNGTVKDVMVSDVCKRDKEDFLKWLKALYRRNKIGWNRIYGSYNRISYLILISPFPYSLFRLYFRHLKSIAKIVNFLHK